MREASRRVAEASLKGRDCAFGATTAVGRAEAPVLFDSPPTPVPGTIRMRTHADEEWDAISVFLPETIQKIFGKAYAAQSKHRKNMVLKNRQSFIKKEFAVK